MNSTSAGSGGWYLHVFTSPACRKDDFRYARAVKFRKWRHGARLSCRFNAGTPLRALYGTFRVPPESIRPAKGVSARKHRGIPVRNARCPFQSSRCTDCFSCVSQTFRSRNRRHDFWRFPPASRGVRKGNQRSIGAEKLLRQRDLRAGRTPFTSTGSPDAIAKQCSRNTGQYCRPGISSRNPPSRPVGRGK